MGVRGFPPPGAGLGISLHEEYWPISLVEDSVNGCTHLIYQPLLSVFITCKLAEGALCAIVQVINEEVTQD